jgi:hypothetical protein
MKPSVTRPFGLSLLSNAAPARRLIPSVKPAPAPVAAPRLMNSRRLILSDMVFLLSYNDMNDFYVDE